ncbi:alpha/beta hydrolase [Pseudomonas syringae]|uniref:alpha/beta hydrolase n=1 Tax=Pseudomonas syringae TaxID=317 RepID=UPI000CD34D10|nr:alpha/beta fold hydrolase [Pseudomonas syringae]MCF5198607.1 alpha/beta hydrolase [Pseudomonas syringae]MCF5211144.1 alpha/beta hydrolase [Pseudomonas syringae]MCF5213667.1 alpha/beta hydrolase [Pseudomonas syringae]MCF5220127.1 alpha/beta hydrolase [Pseudomonas syringae]MCF5265705.1 alpha/beta hydrolase [Pseudomonas syringae]
MTDEKRSERLIAGPAGLIELIIDEPSGSPKGVVLVSHPQPLLGGSPNHLVPLTLARKLSAEGWRVVRPSFRGVGKSAGVHDEGIGESEDSIIVVNHLQRLYPHLPIALVGFSFGAHVYARVACALKDRLHAVALLGLPVGLVPGGRMYEPLELPSECLLLHGEQDEMAPLANLFDWTRTQQRPVVVFSGSNHFFKGCLAQVAQHVATHLDQAL